MENTQLEVWEKILSKPLLLKFELEFRNYQLTSDDTDTFQEFKNRYNIKYNLLIRELGRTRYSEQDIKRWFDTIKKLTKYHSFGKRDGYFANRCVHNGRTVMGKQF